MKNIKNNTTVFPLPTRWVKLILALNYLFFISFRPWTCYSEPVSDPAIHAPAMLDESAAANILNQLGIAQTGPTAPSNIDTVKKQIQIMPTIAMRILQTSHRPITLEEWKTLLADLGIKPAKNLNNMEWAAVLGQMGIDEKYRPESVPANYTPPPIHTPTEEETNALIKQVPPPPAPSTTTAVSGPTALSTPPVADVSVSSSMVMLEKANNNEPSPTSATTLKQSTIDSNPAIPNPPAAFQNPQPSATHMAPPIPKESASLRDRMAHQTISFNIKDMDILEVLRIMSQKSGLNIVAGSKVKGRVTVFLQDVNLMDALKIILESNDLSFTTENDLIHVMTASEYQDSQGFSFNKKTVVQAIPLNHLRASTVEKYIKPLLSKVGQVAGYDWSNSLIVIDTPEVTQDLRTILLQLDADADTQVFQLNYAKVDDIISKVTPLVTKELGSIESDKRSKTIIVRDSKANLANVAAMIAALDKKPREVRIEAKILQIILNDDFQLGVNWDAVINTVNDNRFTGSLAANLAIQPTGNLNGNPGNSGISANIVRSGVNNYTGMIQALRLVGDTNMLSAPRITVLDDQEANILVGTKEAYVTTTVVNPTNGGATTTSEAVNFVDVGVKLHVTPSIAQDNFVLMKITPEVSSVDRTITTCDCISIPIVRTSQSETSVLVKDGNTLLIGGLIENKEEKTINRVPIIGWIPIIGWFFRSISRTFRKAEIAILLTPHIVEGDIASVEVAQFENPDQKKKSMKKREWTE